MISLPVQSDNSPSYVRQIASSVRNLADYVRPTITEISDDYSLAIPNELVVVDASAKDIVLTLGLAKDLARESVSIIRTDNSGNTVTLSAADTVNGQASITIDANYGKIRVSSTGTAWLGV